MFPIRFKSEIEQVDKDSFEEIASAPDNSTKNEKYDTSSILDQSSYLDGYGFSLQTLINAKDFEKLALLQTAADAVSATIEEKKTFQT